MHRAKFKLHPRADAEGKVDKFFHILKMDMRVTLWDPWACVQDLVVVKAPNIKTTLSIVVRYPNISEQAC